MLNMLYVSTRPCPVCASREVKALHNMRFKMPEGSPLPTHYVVACCVACGMVFADSAATDQDYDRHYAQFSKYEDESLASGGGHSDADRERLAEVAEMLAACCASNTRILDVGCANGGLLEALRAAGFDDVAGIDPSPVCVHHVKSRGFKATVMSVSQLTPATIGTYGVVVFSHVLEHMYDARVTLTRLRHLLEDNGLLYIEVPDADGYCTQRSVPFYYFDPEHINHFNPAMLHTLASTIGFDVVTTAVKNIPLTPTFAYPACYIVLRKSTTPPTKRLEVESRLEAAIVAYIQQCSQDGLEHKIRTYAASQIPVIVWGAGSHTQRLLGSTDLVHCNIVAFVDNDTHKQGQEIHGIKIVAPDTLRELEGTILISAAIHAETIKRDISQFGFTHSYDVLS